MKLAILALVSWTICLGTAVLAAETAPVDVSTTTTKTSRDGKRVVIKRIRRAGPSGSASADVPPSSVHCNGNKEEINTADNPQTDGTHRRMHIVMCDDPAASPADRAARLSAARASVAADPDIDPQSKASILARMDARLAQQGATTPPK